MGQKISSNPYAARSPTLFDCLIRGDWYFDKLKEPLDAKEKMIVKLFSRPGYFRIDEEWLLKEQASHRYPQEVL